MKINEIFSDLRHAGLDDTSRKAAQDLVRKILGNRRRMSLDNDVIHLYQYRASVAIHLNILISDLDVIWSVPTVAAHLRESGVICVVDEIVRVEERQDENADIDTNADRDDVVKAIFLDAMTSINHKLLSIQSEVSSYVILASVLNITATIIGVIALKGLPDMDLCDSSCRQDISSSFRTALHVGSTFLKSIISRFL